MAVAVIDTGVLVGMADSVDEHHDVAMEIVRGMDHGDLPTARVTNYIALETLNWIHNRKRHEKAVETYERVNYPTLLPRCCAPRSLRVSSEAELLTANQKSEISGDGALMWTPGNQSPAIDW